MKKIAYIIIAFAAFCLVSCDEWEPVYTFDYDDGEMYETVTLERTHTIMELKEMYNNVPVTFYEDIIVGGQVTTSDESGNIYKSLYIQDESGAIEVKIGQTGLYNDYKLGQWVYVNMNGLTLGDYNGMLQIGVADASGDYETAYLEVKSLISAHIFRGEIDDPIEPEELAVEDFSEAKLGMYVTISDLTYGDEIFALVYVDPNQNKSDYSNRVFLSDKTYGVTTWAMSEQGYKNYLSAGNFDTATTSSAWTDVYGKTHSSVADETLKAEMLSNATAYSVSQYFITSDGETDVQVRTSGYAEFADTEIDSEILDGTAKVSFTGILTYYSDSYQFTLIDLDGVTKQ